MTSSSTTDEKKPVVDDVVIEELKIGLWQMKIGHPTTLSARRYLETVQSAYPLFHRLFSDIYSASPHMFRIFILCQLWHGIEDAILMHISNSLLYKVEQGIVTGNPDTYGIMIFVFLHVTCSMFAAYLSWHGEAVLEVLRSRVTSYFNLHLMKARLRVDLPTSQEAASTPEGSGSNAWEALEQIIGFLTEILTVGSQLAVIIQVSRNTGGPIFGLICISRPIISAYFSRDLWDKVCFGFIDNKHHQRLRTLEDFATGAYREDVIANNLTGWIIKEYRKSRKEIGDSVDSPPYSIYSQRESPFFEMFVKFLGDLPSVYCAVNAVINPSRFSLASIAILQQSSSTLRYSLESIFYATKRFKRGVNSIRKLYDASKVINALEEGNIPYPPPSENADVENTGMGFELRNVSFAYPGSQKNGSALRNISLRIKPGELVVLVGENGCGKSTMIRILSRLYDPSSGEILINGHLSKDYRIGDLHSATAILSQDNLLYPVSLEENIGLGYPEFSSDREMVKEAADAGGALNFVEKLKHGLQTSLQSYMETFDYNLYGNKTHPLYKELEKLEKTISISGGEKQRIVASRCFMRFKSGKVKFVAVDEPSSALDAKGELQLFKRLLDARAGKTMVFVTHRFGHLTKHADLIICMKDGSIAESGTHDGLMAKDGEYAKLYNIQACAFDHNSDAK